MSRAGRLQSKNTGNTELGNKWNQCILTGAKNSTTNPSLWALSMKVKMCSSMYPGVWEINKFSITLCLYQGSADVTSISSPNIWVSGQIGCLTASCISPSIVARHITDGALRGFGSLPTGRNKTEKQNIEKTVRWCMLYVHMLNLWFWYILYNMIYSYAVFDWSMFIIWDFQISHTDGITTQSNWKTNGLIASNPKGSMTHGDRKISLPRGRLCLPGFILSSLNNFICTNAVTILVSEPWHLSTAIIHFAKSKLSRLLRQQGDTLLNLQPQIGFVLDAFVIFCLHTKLYIINYSNHICVQLKLMFQHQTWMKHPTIFHQPLGSHQTIRGSGGR